MHPNSHMRALKTLGNLEQISGCFIVQTLLQKLDVKTQKKWDDACSSDKVPTAEEFFEFLERRCQKLDSVQYSTSANSHVGKSSQNANPRKAFVVETSQGGCGFCDERGHGIYSCSRFANLSPSLRHKKALGPASTSSVANSPSSTTARSATSLAAQGLQSGVELLATAVVMRLQLKETKAVGTGLGDTHFSTDGSAVKIQMKSSTSEYSATFDALVAPTITDSQPSFAIDTSDWKIPSNIKKR
ncbi:hypothetical protein ACLKA7_005015 [Drosophila subpalustris]